MYARSRSRDGFTLIELLVVMVIVAVMVSLLLTAVTGAMRTAKNAAVSAEIDTLGQALAAFKEKYGDYPPSRVLLAENGFYDTSSNTARTTYLNSSSADITYAALAQRSLSYLRKFWPRVQFSTTGPLFDGTTTWHDFDGSGTMNPNPVILEGHECLVFFLGGIPANTGTSGDPKFAVTGWGRRPTLPFTNNAGDPTRTVPMFEFKGGRLSDRDNNNGFPGYLDSLATNRPYAYFSSYGNGQYDPNDMNFAVAEPDDAGTVTNLSRLFRVAFPVQSLAGSTGTGNGGDDRIAISPAPNPFTTSEANPPDRPNAWEKVNSFQVISAGADGLYGAAGQYDGGETDKLPLELDRRTTTTTTASIRNLNSTDGGSRGRERDNITNFSGGVLD